MLKMSPAVVGAGVVEWLLEETHVLKVVGRGWPIFNIVKSVIKWGNNCGTVDREVTPEMFSSSCYFKTLLKRRK